ncbi:hypothetical protein L6164_009869 [Bauhinia variegata]|uniref:Uncharacterized protein n=1 Tax=Bauhinia variegata TaxID=167791 RepID=A0ACB9PKI0_BAUVA|nr:hypothetical protein L6164_009869 [Bauhinia variegata]
MSLPLELTFTNPVCNFFFFHCFTVQLLNHGQGRNDDSWLNLSLAPPQPETHPLDLPLAPSHQETAFPVSQYSEAPPQFLEEPIPSHHNNQDQPSLSSQVPVPRLSLRRQRRDKDPRFAAPRPLNIPEPVRKMLLAIIQGKDQDQGEAAPSRYPDPRALKSVDIDPPYQWATRRRAQVQSLDELLSKGMHLITGQVKCKYCNKVFDMEFNLQSKFLDVAQYIRSNKGDMQGLAPSVWVNPVLPSCQECHLEDCAKPVFHEKKRNINWLFLLLGQMLGCCKRGHLRYFIRHAMGLSYRFASKERSLYVTYMRLCKQLHPSGPFDDDL